MSESPQEKAPQKASPMDLCAALDDLFALRERLDKEFDTVQSHIAGLFSDDLRKRLDQALDAIEDHVIEALADAPKSCPWMRCWRWLKGLFT